MSKDDRNTAIIVAVVLVVCTISLVVIGGYLWRLISPGLNKSLNSVGVYVKLTTTNYNFVVPKKGTTNASSGSNSGSTSASTPPAFQLPEGYTYNFVVPAGYKSTNGESITGIVDQQILADARLQAYGSRSAVTQADGFLTIPILGIASPVYSGFSGNELNIGFWEYPRGDRQILLCQREYFALGDKRSCWDLDKLQLGTEIFMNRGDVVTRYVIKEINTITHVSDFTYSLKNPRELQIITSTPHQTGEDRLQIVALPELAVK